VEHQCLPQSSALRHSGTVLSRTHCDGDGIIIRSIVIVCCHLASSLTTRHFTRVFREFCDNSYYYFSRNVAVVNPLVGT